MTPVRVAYVVGRTAGGTGTHVAMLARGCAERGMTVTVYGPPEVAERFLAPTGTGGGASPRPGTPRFVPAGIGDRPRPGRDAAALARLRSLLARDGPDVVHAHGMRAGALAALALAGTRRRGRLVVTVHNAPPEGGAAGAVHAVLERIVARRADLVTCVSSDLTARMGRLGARDGGRAVVPALPTGPPAATQAAQAREELGGGRRPVVLAAGRLAPQKGFATLLEAATHWRDRQPAPLVVIAGEGPLSADLRGRAAGAGLDVRFLGQRGDIPALLAAADVFVLPSVWEGQPLILAEALRAGLPVVAFRVGGVADLTGEDAAVLVPAGDTGAFAAAVSRVLDKPGLATSLAAAARSRAAALPGAADAIDAADALYRRALAT